MTTGRELADWELEIRHELFPGGVSAWGDREKGSYGVLPGVIDVNSGYEEEDGEFYLSAVVMGTEEHDCRGAWLIFDVSVEIIPPLDERPLADGEPAWYCYDLENNENHALVRLPNSAYIRTAASYMRYAKYLKALSNFYYGDDITDHSDQDLFDEYYWNRGVE